MKIAIVRVRGNVRITKEVKDTLRMLNLEHKNHATIVEETVIVKGMVKRVMSFVTWGPVNETTAAALAKKGKEFFPLNPPKKGYGLKGVKVAYSQGGAVGNRGEKINDLIMRMM